LPIIGFKDDQAEPMNEGAQNFLIQCPISLYQPFFQAFSQQNLVAGMILAAKPQSIASGLMFRFRQTLG